MKYKMVQNGNKYDVSSEEVLDKGIIQFRYRQLDTQIANLESMVNHQTCQLAEMTEERTAMKKAMNESNIPTVGNA